MKKHKHIAIIETSDLLYAGLLSILGQSNEEYIVTRLFSIDEIDSLSSNMIIDILFINPILIINKGKEVKKIRKNFPQMITAGVNINILDNKTLSLYDLTINIYDSPNQIISVINKQLKQKQSKENERDNDETLSERETQVLLQLIKGLTNKDIAEILNISVHTVISHRKNIMQKTGIRSQAGLALYAISKSLIFLDDFDI